MTSSLVIRWRQLGNPWKEERKEGWEEEKEGEKKGEKMKMAGLKIYPQFTLPHLILYHFNLTLSLSLSPPKHLCT